jgi:hypothetical protein
VTKGATIGTKGTPRANARPWVSFILMALTMYLYISQMQKIGALSSTPQLLTSLPEGVTSVIGYANRLLVVSYLGWLIVVNLLVIKISKKVVKI